MELSEAVLFESDEFLVIDKPAGLSVHKDQDESGLVMTLAAQRGEPLWLVHRIDKLTSGLLLLARNSEAAALLSREFAEHRVDKLYVALSRRKPKRKQGRIRGDMEAARRGSWRLLRTAENPAITDFIVRSVGDGLKLILCRPLTGKTHQIRVALKSEGAPILGDRRYEDGRETPVDRGYLHAWKLSFYFRGQYYHFTTAPKQGVYFRSEAFVRLLKELDDPASLPQNWKLVSVGDAV